MGTRSTPKTPTGATMTAGAGAEHTRHDMAGAPSPTTPANIDCQQTVITLSGSWTANQLAHVTAHRFPLPKMSSKKHHRHLFHHHDKQIPTINDTATTNPDDEKKHSTQTTSNTITLDGKNITQMDTAGALAICDYQAALTAAGFTTTLAHFTESQTALIQLIADQPDISKIPDSPGHGTHPSSRLSAWKRLRNMYSSPPSSHF